MWLVYAAIAACCFGIRGILYQRTSQYADRNMLLLGVYLCGAILTLALNVIYSQPWSSGVLMGLAMGAFSFVSNSAMHKGFTVGKVSLVALITGLPPLVVVLAALALWGERLTSGQTLAFLAILGGGLLIKSSSGLSFSNMKGAQWGLLSMFAFAMTDLLSKQASLIGSETLPTLSVMFITGSVLFGLGVWSDMRRAARRNRTATTTNEPSPSPAHIKVNQRWSSTKVLLVGLAVGLLNGFGMILLMTAMQTGVTGLVSAIIALNSLIVMMYAWTALKERMRPMELTGMLVSLAGVLALRLLG